MQGIKWQKSNVFKMFLEWQLRSRHLVKLKHVIRTRAGPKFSEWNEFVWFVLGANFQFRSFLERASHGLIYSTQLLTPFSGTTFNDHSHDLINFVMSKMVSQQNGSYQKGCARKWCQMSVTFLFKVTYAIGELWSKMNLKYHFLL